MKRIHILPAIILASLIHTTTQPLFNPWTITWCASRDATTFASGKMVEYGTSPMIVKYTGAATGTWIALSRSFSALCNLCGALAVFGVRKSVASDMQKKVNEDPSIAFAAQLAIGLTAATTRDPYDLAKEALTDSLMAAAGGSLAMACWYHEAQQ